MTPQARILVVEDKPNERDALTRCLQVENYQVVAADGPKAALRHLNDGIDVVISDLKLGKTDGVDLLAYWKDRQPATPFIMLTTCSDRDAAVEAMKLGAQDYLNRPVNREELLILISRCLLAKRKDDLIAGLQQRLDDRLGFERIVGRSKVMLEVFDYARRAAMSESTVLITGESGTGKELIAQAIHQNSPRSERPFVTVNLAAVPEHLVESELFGHVKGAFTGATESRTGRFENAAGGTIFIDEIGDLQLASQAKLLRVLAHGTVTPIGSNDDRNVNVRLVAATSRDLEQMVREETFRKDLYYRLNVVNLRLPPLRERREDIPLLVSHFLGELCRAANKPQLRIETRLREFMQTHHWPGNVRQLRNSLESMIVLASGDTLTLEDLPAIVANDLSTPNHVAIPPNTTLDDLEREAIEQALVQHDGNRTHAAESLGISVRTLQRKLKAWRDELQTSETAAAG